MIEYNYKVQKASLFTEDGQVMFLKVRDAAHKHIKEAGAVRMDKLIAAAGSGDVWDMLACADRLIELGEMFEIPNPKSSAGQYRLFSNFES